MNTFFWTIGTLAGATVATALVPVVWKRLNKGRATTQTVDSDNITYYEHATISATMEPHFALLDLQGAVITIVGSDGCYLADAERRAGFIQRLKTWLGRGAKFHYVLVNASDEGAEALKAFARDVDTDAFTYTILTDADETTQQMVDIADEFDELHPTLIRLANGDRAMWVEYEHRRGEVIAENCKFVPPFAFKRDSIVQEEFAEYDQKIAVLLANLQPKAA